MLASMPWDNSKILEYAQISVLISSVSKLHGFSWYKAKEQVPANGKYIWLPGLQLDIFKHSSTNDIGVRKSVFPVWNPIDLGNSLAFEEL